VLNGVGGGSAVEWAGSNEVVWGCLWGWVVVGGVCSEVGDGWGAMKWCGDAYWAWGGLGWGGWWWWLGCAVEWEHSMEWPPGDG
jgi:hypothetical protein